MSGRHHRPSRRARHLTVSLLVAGASAALIVPAAPAVAASTPSAPVVVVNGLNNPRQLAFDPAGRLLIAEAGKAGRTCLGSGANAMCIGRTGSVSRVDSPRTAARTRPVRIITGLLSAGGADGTFAVGSDGVAGLSGKIYVAMTYAPPDVVPNPLPARQLGKLLVARPYGPVAIDADITAVEFRCPNCDGYRDPTTHQPELDSNPYAVLALPGRELVADAAGNDIIEVRNGHARVFAVLPRHGSADTDRQATPTTLARGPHDTILVGELAHEEPGAARIDVLSAGGGYLGYIGRGGSILGVPGGLSTITGVAYDGSAYYVSQLEAGDPNLPGLLTRIDAKTGRTTNVAVPFPAGVATDGHGNVYVAAWSIASDQGAFGVPHSAGQVWRIRF